MARFFRELRLLIVMDVRELLATRAYWLMLLAVSALVGQAFLSAVEFYAEASGAGGGPAALSQGLSPLEGILVPTFGAYDLAATLLFPFVVIRLIAHERQNGALWLQLQAPPIFGVTMASKGLALLLAWFVAMLPGCSALLLWHNIGGHLYPPETLGLLLGYVLRGVSAIGFCAAAAAFSTSAASAAVIALTFTIGTWALDYFAAARGGVLAVIATYTPLAALRTFERGEIQLATIGILAVVGMSGLALATTAAPSGRTLNIRMLRSTAALGAAILLCVLAARIRTSADVSENRRNSFSRTDEVTLANIGAPLSVDVFLAAEDPRLNDLERGILAKLRRVVPHLTIRYPAAGRSGLFQSAGDHYGEVWYESGGRRLMSRSTIEEVVLETVYQVTGATPPPPDNAPTYPGYPLRAHSTFAPWLFFLAWPLLIAGAWIGSRRQRVQRVG
ncbi:MAG: hypothetical protein ABJB74_05365 [Gemmatimonas sp.]